MRGSFKKTAQPVSHPQRPSPVRRTVRLLFAVLDWVQSWSLSKSAFLSRFSFPWLSFVGGGTRCFLAGPIFPSSEDTSARNDCKTSDMATRRLFHTPLRRYDGGVKRGSRQLHRPPPIAMMTPIYLCLEQCASVYARWKPSIYRLQRYLSNQLRDVCVCSVFYWPAED